jgi:hypothetical protein
MIGTVIKVIIHTLLSVFRKRKTSKEALKVKEDRKFAEALLKGDSKTVGQKWKKRKNYS